MQIRANGNGATPSGWRSVYSEFAKLKAVAKSKGIDSSSWYIDVPSRGKGLFRTWTIHWQPPKSSSQTDSALGRNSDEAIMILQDFIKLYSQWVGVRRRPAITRGERIPPHRDPKILAEHATMVQYAMRYPERASEYQLRYGPYSGNKVPWDRLKAGILQMSILKYHSTTMGMLHPVPPQNEEELRRYRADTEKYLNEKSESDRKWKEQHGNKTPQEVAEEAINQAKRGASHVSQEDDDYWYGEKKKPKIEKKPEPVPTEYAMTDEMKEYYITELGFTHLRD